MSEARRPANGWRHFLRTHLTDANGGKGEDIVHRFLFSLPSYLRAKNTGTNWHGEVIFGTQEPEKRTLVVHLIPGNRDLCFCMYKAFNQTSAGKGKVYLGPRRLGYGNIFVSVEAQTYCRRLDELLANRFCGFFLDPLFFIEFKSIWLRIMPWVTIWFMKALMHIAYACIELIFSNFYIFYSVLAFVWILLLSLYLYMQFLKHSILLWLYGFCFLLL